MDLRAQSILTGALSERKTLLQVSVEPLQVSSKRQQKYLNVSNIFQNVGHANKLI